MCRILTSKIKSKAQVLICPSKYLSLVPVGYIPIQVTTDCTPPDSRQVQVTHYTTFWEVGQGPHRMSKLFKGQETKARL